MGGSEHLQLDSTPATSAPDPAANASAQRHCGLGQDAENRLATVPATGAVKADFVLDPGRFRTKLPVETAALSPSIEMGLTPQKAGESRENAGGAWRP